MAVTTVSIVNQTAAPILLADLGETLGASATLLLSDEHKGYEIFASEDLRGRVSAGDIVFDLGSGPLSVAASQEFYTESGNAAESTYDGTTSGSAATTIQEALDEVLGALSSSSPRRGSFYSAGNSTAFTGLTVAPLDTLEEGEGSAFALQSTGVVECLVAGTYRVVFDVNIDIAAGTARSVAESSLYLNGVQVAGTQRYTYHRTVGSGSQSGTGRAVLDLVPTDTLEIRTSRFDGGDTLRLLPGCHLSIEAYTGGPGAQGPQGPSGPGSTVVVEDEGVDLNPGNRFGVLNFPLGCNASLTGTTVNIEAGLPGIGIVQVAEGSTLGLGQQRKASQGQIGKTVLAVGYTYFETGTGPSVDHKAQIASLGDGNVVFVYATGSDFTSNVVQEGPIFLGLGEIYVIENVQPGTIITATEGAYGCSQQYDGGFESPMPLLSLALSFTDSFFYGFRNAGTTDSYLHVVNGPLESEVTLTNGSGTVILAQQDVALDPWEHRIFDLSGTQEYRILSTANIMACTNANMDDVEGGGGTAGFYDSRVVMPVTNDGITWPRSGFMSAPYAGTSVRYRVNTGANGTFTVSPGGPVNIAVTTGASDPDYEPTGATRFFANGLVSAYSGADTAGLEATPMCPTAFATQRIALPMAILNLGDGGNNGIALASPYEGTARLYQWNSGTGQSDLVSVQEPGTGTLVTEIPIVRRSGAVTTREDQNYPASASIVRGVGSGGVDPNSYGLTGTFTGGYIETNVPCVCVFNSEQNANGGTAFSFRGTSGASVVGINAEDDEQLTFGITPSEIRAVIRQGEDGLLYRQSINAGVETWVIA